MSFRTSRRTFLTAATMAGVGYWVSTARAQDSNSPNERIRFACIGVDGKGRSDSDDAARFGDVVAICDVDDAKLNGRAASEKFAKAEKFNDFREMLDKMHKSIDAVTVSTPDHVHAVASVSAMKLGKHCFTQKPLTKCVYEARRMAEVARANKCKTQMGNQGTANNTLREMAAMLQAGVVGKVTECHVWTNRPIWPQGGERAAPKPVPKGVHWDLWVGPAPFREYAPGYHPFAWRGWWDFGTGALGDMACHTLNMPYMGLDLKDPIALEAKHSGHNKDSFPAWSEITYWFPANDKRGEVVLHWYDGKRKPSADLLPGAKPVGKGQVPHDSGALIIGDKGALYAPGDYAENGAQYLGGAEPVKVDYEKSPGHFQEWVEAIQGKREQARSNFPDYSGGLTETVVLGNLAVWAGEKIEWDAKTMSVKGHPELEPLIRNPYREGYTVD